MLSDRKYIVNENELKLTLQEFEDRFSSSIQDVSAPVGSVRQSKTISRDKLQILAAKIDDPSDTIIVFYPEDKKIGLKQIEQYVIILLFTIFTCIHLCVCKYVFIL